MEELPTLLHRISVRCLFPFLGVYRERGYRDETVISNNRCAIVLYLISMPPRFHATPRESISEIVQDVVILGDTQFRIRRPIDSDALMDHAWVRSAYAADGYTPYWAKLWPSARMLAKVVLRERWTPTD